MVADALSEELAGLIASGCRDQRMGISAASVTKLTAYLRLLAQWNKVYNLTAIRDPRAMVHRHILDSLAVLPYIKGSSLVDVGTGAGLPGLPLAIVKPELTVCCLDSSAKKLRFVQQVITELEIENAVTLHARVEDHQPATGYDQVISRAFTSLVEMHQLTRHLCAAGGQWLAMKGKNPLAELDALRACGVAPETIELFVAGLDENRHLVSWHLEKTQTL